MILKNFIGDAAFVVKINSKKAMHCYDQTIDTMPPAEPLDSVKPLALWTVSVLHEEIAIVKSALVKPDRPEGIKTSFVTSLPE